MAKPGITILDVMNDQKLLGKTFRPTLLRGDSWKTWRVFLAALFGLPMDAEAVETFRKHTGRSNVPQGPFQEAFLVCGRRSGKSIVMALVAVFLACFKDYTDVLAPGESATLMVLASDRRQAQVIFKYVDAFLSIPVLKTMVVDRFKESIELSNHIKIETHTSSYKATRGFTLIGVICDELAFWSDESSANPDKEILTALRPGLATTNGLLLGVSSPYAKKGQLWEEYKSGYGKDDAPALVWQSDSRSMNPTLSRVTVGAAYMRDAASARAEYGGEFRSDIESFLAMEAIARCVAHGRSELPPFSSESYSAFVDPSGGTNDSMTLAIAHIEKEKAILDCVREVKPPFSPEAVCEEFCTLLKRYRIFEVVGDHYGGEWPREQFSKRGIVYKLCEQTRSELYLELLAALMSGSIELLDNAILINQLSSLERKTGKLQGRDAVDHVAGGHDDVSNAAAGVLVGAIGVLGGGRLGFLEFFETGRAEKFWSGLSEVFRAPGRPKVGAVARATSALTVCPRCGDTRLTELGLGPNGPVFRCERCHQHSDAGFSMKAEGCTSCGSKAPPQVIAGGALRCQQCAAQTWPAGFVPPKPAIINRKNIRESSFSGFGRFG